MKNGDGGHLPDRLPHIDSAVRRGFYRVVERWRAHPMQQKKKAKIGQTVSHKHVAGGLNSEIRSPF